MTNTDYLWCPICELVHAIPMCELVSLAFPRKLSVKWTNEMEDMAVAVAEKKARRELGKKHDDGKLKFTLFPVEVLEEVVRVLMLGAKKYDDENWKFVDNARERYYNACLRHLTAWWKGETFDPESSHNHVAHAICNLAFLLWFDLRDKK